MGTIFKATLSEVAYFYPKTRLFIILVALLAATQIIPDLVTNIIATTAVLTVGLMHGATDHVLYTNSNKIKFKSKIPKAFVVKYLTILIFMGLVWLFLPKLALVIFLLVSAYHFGQTQLQYVPIRENSILKKLYYFSWGILILSLIILLNLEESKSLIISAIPEIDLSAIDSDNGAYVIMASFIIIIIIGIGIYKNLSWCTTAFEAMELIAIAALSYQNNLLVSFGLFFGLWHSLRASQIQIDKINSQEKFTTKSFIKESLPFTILSIFGIGMMLLVTYLYSNQIKIEMLFLVAISMLTLPHMFIYESFYNYFDRH